MLVFPLFTTPAGEPDITGMSAIKRYLQEGLDDAVGNSKIMQGMAENYKKWLTSWPTQPVSA